MGMLTAPRWACPSAGRSAPACQGDRTACAVGAQCRAQARDSLRRCSTFKTLRTIMPTNPFPITTALPTHPTSIRPPCRYAHALAHTHTRARARMRPCASTCMLRQRARTRSMNGHGLRTVDGGSVVGSRLGARLGAAVGPRLGDPDGCSVGDSVGCIELYSAAPVGASDGVSDGNADGPTLGVPVGRALGACMGKRPCSVRGGCATSCSRAG